MHLQKSGFTLAEVLIALALLGVVAAFTIPKVLQTSGNQEKLTRTKSALASVYQVFHGAWVKGELIHDQTTLTNLLDTRLNAQRDTTSQVDVAVPTSPGTPIAVGNCGDGTRICYRFVDGTMLTVNRESVYRSGTNTVGNKYAMWMTIDPDGKVNGTTSKIGDAISIFMVNDGHLYTAGQTKETYTIRYTGGGGESNVDPGEYSDPSWLTW